MDDVVTQAPPSPASFSQQQQVYYDNEGRVIGTRTRLHRRPFWRTTGGIVMLFKMLLTLLILLCCFTLLLLGYMGIFRIFAPADVAIYSGFIGSLFGAWFGYAAGEGEKQDRQDDVVSV